MVVVGDTTVLPLSATLPMPLMETVEAPAVVQLKVDCCPTWMLGRLAAHNRICGLPAGVTGTGTTVIKMAAVTEWPSVLVAVRV